MKGCSAFYNAWMSVGRLVDRLLFALFMIGLPAAVPSCSRESPSPSGGKPNVLLITLDTTRADFLSCYGGPQGTTPQIDKIASEGLRFEHCYTTAPITLPAHATMMTGLMPFQHQLRDNGAGVLDDQAVTLAELFRDAGYRTGAFVGAYVLHSRYGLNQGFEVYGDEFRGAVAAHMHDGTEFAERRAADVSDAAIAWVQKQDDRPLFLWVHYFDPHAPYEAPGRKPGGSTRTEYAAEIQYVDTQLQRVLDAVAANSKAAGREEWVVITADHGEGLGEHNEDTHGYFTYNTTLRVPLIVRGPGIPRGQISQEPVSLIDLYPSIKRWLGFSTQSTDPGRALPPAGGSLPQRALYFETRIPFHAYGWSPLTGVVAGSDKYISAPNPELYAISTDPGEMSNQYQSRRDRAAELAEMLTRVQSPEQGVPILAARAAEEDAASLRKLRSLGYVSSPRDAPGGEQRLLDPKQVIWIKPKLLEAEQLLHAGDPKAALLIAEVFKTDPHNLKALNLIIENLRRPESRGLVLPIARSRILEPLLPPFDMELPAYLGISLCREGNIDEGLEVISKAEAVDPRSPIPKAARGECLEQAGRAGEAIAMWEAVLRDNPQDVTALKALGDSLVRSKELVRAADYYRRAVAAQESDAESHAKLGSVLRLLGKPAEAVQQLRKALELSPQTAALNSELGSLLLELGKPAEAVEAYSRFVAARPDDASGHYDLGVAYAQLDKATEAEAQFRESLRLSPNHGDALINLGVMLLRQGKANEGIVELTRATGIPDAAGAAHYNLAIAAAQKRDRDLMRRHLDAAVSCNPPSLPAAEAFAKELVREKAFAQAVRVLRTGLAAAPNQPSLQYLLATILASCPDDSVRNGREALTLAEMLAGPAGQTHPLILSTIASAQAEVGDFDGAAQTVSKALQQGGAAPLRAVLQKQLELFQSKKPYRELELLELRQ